MEPLPKERSFPRLNDPARNLTRAGLRGETGSECNSNKQSKRSNGAWHRVCLCKASDRSVSDRSVYLLCSSVSLIYFLQPSVDSIVKKREIATHDYCVRIWFATFDWRSVSQWFSFAFCLFLLILRVLMVGSNWPSSSAQSPSCEHSILRSPAKKCIIWNCALAVGNGPSIR